MRDPIDAEEWRSIKGYEGQYQISSRGRVRTLKHCRGVTVLAPYRNPVSGYIYVTLSDRSRQKHFAVHVLVAETFLGQRPDGMEVCHGDNVKQNNAVGNLRWGTRSSNHQDKWTHDTMLYGERSPRAKLTVQQVLDIRRLSAYFTSHELALGYPASPGQIAAIIRRQAWAWLPEPPEPEEARCVRPFRKRGPELRENTKARSHSHIWIRLAR